MWWIIGGVALYVAGITGTLLFFGGAKRLNAVYDEGLQDHEG